MRAFVSLQAGDLFAVGEGAPGPEVEGPGPYLSVEALESALRGAGGKLRFVRPQARHLTLKFLGEVEEARAPEIGAALGEAARRFTPFGLGARGVGFFPNAVRPRVIWVGVDDPGKQVGPLFAAVDKALSGLGFERGKEAFVPHITVARVGEAPPGDALAQAVDPLVQTRFGWTRATGVELVQSSLNKGGAVHRVVSQHPFQGTRK